MAATRTAPAARPVAAAKSGSCRLASLPRDEAKARLLAGMAIELLVRFEGEPADLPPHSYWLALETPANATPAYRLTKVEEEDGDGAGCDFDLGYAITCHKSQGSEWPCVIILADPSPGARRVCSREWIYTAISRASQLCITIGKLGVLHQMTARVSLEKRKTFLVEELGRVG
jgi:hypothetical protein